MYTNFSIKNFRVFDQEGADLAFRPITILTGCNNSGKSSITKALCLLKDFCRQIEEDYAEDKPLQLERYKIDFWKAPNSILGSFDNVLHHNSNIEGENVKSSNNNNHIVFELVVQSSWLLQDVILHLEFGSLAEDDLNNGYLKSYIIKSLDGRIIYQDSIDDGEACMDFSFVKNHLLCFLYGQYAYSEANNILHMPDEMQEERQDEIDARIEELNSINQFIYSNFGQGAFMKLKEWHFSQRDNIHGKNVMEKVPDPSFVFNSPELGVYCYFPCLKELSDIKKENVRQKINAALAAHKSNHPISSFEQKMIDLFIDSFESSNTSTLHEYISQEENKIFFVHDSVLCIARINKLKRFAFPVMSGVTKFGGAIYFDEDDLPEKADWEVILRSMDIINQAITNTTESFTRYDEPNGCIEYITNFDVDEYIRKTIEEIFANIMPGQLTYSPTTIVQPRRLYSLEDTNDFANTLNKYFEKKLSFEDPYSKQGYDSARPKPYKICSFINKWLDRFDVARRVEIKAVAENSGAIVRLYGKNDRKGMLLVDKGLGIGQLFAVLLKIENAIIELKLNEAKYKYGNFGLNNNSFSTKARAYNEINPITVALEEPEVHLHPRYQSLLADMIVEAYQKYNVHFIIETHSEYLIRKLQVLVADKKCPLTSANISLNYVERESSGRTMVRKIDVREDGRLDGSFGEGFFDEAGGLSRRLLTLSY